MANRPKRDRLVIERREALSRTLDLFSELIGVARRDAIDEALGAARVQLVVRPEDLGTRQTQAAVYILASLLARSGIGLEADLARTPRLVTLPGLDDPDFGRALRHAVTRMMPGAELHSPGGRPDIVVSVGPAAPPSGAASLVRVAADGSTAWVRRGTDEVPVWRPTDALTAIAAASLAAGEVHKDVVRRASIGPIEVLDPQEPSFVVPFVLAGPIAIGHLEAISAGAITQNLLLTLAAEEAISANVRLFDRDTVELSNANRCPFVFIDRLDDPKVMRIAALVPQRLQIEPVPRHLDAGTAGSIARRSTIVVGADDIAVRHRAQELEPSWLGIGATSHFLALVTEHPAGSACAGCAHARLGEDTAIIPTVSIVSFWAGYLLALRLIARAAGNPYPPSRQVTNFWPLRPTSIFEHPLAVNPHCPLTMHRSS